MSQAGRGRGLDLAVLALVFVLAAAQRLAWSDLLFNEDWEWIFRFAADMGASRGEHALFLYSSAPALLFGLLAAPFDGPMLPLRLWALLGSLGAPLLYLACRQVAPRLPAALAALALAFSVSDAHTAIGLRTPYLASTFVALGLLGLAAGSRRRWWGPPLLAGGMALAVSFHLGLWPLSIATCLVAAVLLVRLRGRDAILGWLGAIGAGGAVVGLLAVLDGAHLASDLRLLSESGFPPGLDARPTMDWALRFGLGGPPALVLAAFATCIMGFGAWLEALYRGEPGDPRRTAGGVGLAALLLWLAAGSDFVHHGIQDAYLWYHHLIPLQPMLLLALVGSVRCLMPEHPSQLERTLCWSLLVAWLLQAVSGVPTAMADRMAIAPTPTRSVLATASLAAAVGEHAVEAQRNPSLLWLDRRAGLFDPCLQTGLAEALAGWQSNAAHDARAYAVMPASVAQGLGWSNELELEPALGWSIHVADSQRALFQETRGRCPDLHHQRCARCIVPKGGTP